jgi:hypothetical protein
MIVVIDKCSFVVKCQFKNQYTIEKHNSKEYTAFKSSKDKHKKKKEKGLIVRETEEKGHKLIIPKTDTSGNNC